MVSFTMFAAVFALLGIWPRRYPYLIAAYLLTRGHQTTRAKA